MRNPKDNFSVYFEDNREMAEFCEHMDVVMDYLREHPFGEFQLKNLIRYTMNISKISNILNEFELSIQYILLDYIYRHIHIFICNHFKLTR